MEPSDQYYIDRIQSGDQEAYRFLIRRYQDFCLAVSVTLTSDQSDAIEVVHRAFVKAWLKLDSFQGRSSFKTWLYRIVFNEALMFLRKEKRSVEVKLLNYGDSDNATRSPGIESLYNGDDYVVTNVSAEQAEFDNTLSGSLAELEQQDRTRLIQACFNRIGKTEALALQLFYLDDLSINEIAEVTGWTKPKVKVLLFRGRSSLKHVLTHELQIRKEDIL